MFRRILVPLDETVEADDALAAARFFAERDGARLVLLHVAPDASREGGHTAATTDLRSRAQLLNAHGIESEMLLETGDPAKVIARVARTRQADLVVAAPHRRHGLDGLLHPSVTRRIFSTVSVPTYVCAGRVASTRRQPVLDTHTSLVIVPLDGSEHAEQAIAPAMAFAREYGRTLLLLRAVGPSGYIDSGTDASWWEMQELANAKRTALESLRQSRHRIKHDFGIGAQTMLCVGEPGAQIAAVAQAHPGSLIVMSTHGRTGLARLALGSVTYDVVTRAPAPVLVVPVSDADIHAPARVGAHAVSEVEAPLA